MINYQHYSDEKKNFVADNDEFENELVVNEEPEQDEVEEVESEVDEEPVIDIVVVSASKIYLREKPTKESKDLAVLEKGCELLSDESKSTEDWYSVVTASGLEGYVMKELVEVR